MKFHQDFNDHGAWRKQLALQLKLLGDWLGDQDLLDLGVLERLDLLQSQIINDKMMVAFVAEFSRGKSELINAVFFADYGCRILPAGAGRTTMCPTELGYDAEMPSCIRLLPIETRLLPTTLLSLRNAPEKWESVRLEVNDPQQLAASIQKVAEVRRVSCEEATRLGFWSEEAPQDNPLLGVDGLVEIPKWRHALINIDHPLLKQGVVILDTPGLNAIGAEPELTVSLLPQAQAVVFILATDTGVTKSDLAIWREHLMPTADASDARLIVLNKIDMMWDALSSPEQVQLQIDAQRADSARIFDLSPDQVLAVSAQKGLWAKISKDSKLLAASNLMSLELALGERLMGRRRLILCQAVSQTLVALRQETDQLLHARLRDSLEQIQELEGLRGKNIGVIKQMHLRIEQEQDDFDGSGAKIQAMRSVHLRLLADLFELLDHAHLKKNASELAGVLKKSGFKFGVRRVYGNTFNLLNADMIRSEKLIDEIQTMLEASFKRLNTEYGFSLHPPSPPKLAAYQNDLALIEKGYVQYLGLNNTLRLIQPEFAGRLARALVSKIKITYDAAINEVELWNKLAISQLDAQLRERRRNFGHRIDAVLRIQQAAGGLDDRIDELRSQYAQLRCTQAKLVELTDQLIDSVNKAECSLQEGVL